MKQLNTVLKVETVTLTTKKDRVCVQYVYVNGKHVGILKKLRGDNPWKAIKIGGQVINEFPSGETGRRMAKDAIIAL